MSQGSGIWKRFWPLAAAQFFGVFNDHAFKIVAIFAAVGASEEYSTNTAFLALLTIFYALPFILFPSPAGYFSDRFPKRHVIVIIKFIELAIMLCGTICLAKFADWERYQNPSLLLRFSGAGSETCISSVQRSLSNAIEFSPEDIFTRHFPPLNGISEPSAALYSKTESFSFT